MTRRISSVWSACIVAVLTAAIPTVYAQAPSGFRGRAGQDHGGGQ